MIEDDGDIIKGLGYVTMHGAHLEGRFEDLFFQLSNIESYTEKDKRLPISGKIKKAKKILTKINHPLMTEIIDDLESCREHFEWRNELVHGRIYSPEYKKENLESSRLNVPNRAASSEEIYRLANNLVALNSRVFRPMIIELPKVLAEMQANA
jgi:hypothetical protein